MSFEIWFFSGRTQYRRTGGLMAIETAPPTYALADAEALAKKMAEAYAAEGHDVTTVIRTERSY